MLWSIRRAIRRASVRKTHRRSPRSSRAARVSSLATVAALCGLCWHLSWAAAAAAEPPEAITLAGEDQRQMMRQLGIEALRPGRSSNENAPDHANYDEALANPYPDLPDPLTLNDGRKVTSARMWWHERRPQIVAAFERDVYGRIPPRVPKVSWRIAATETDRVGGIPVRIERLIGHVDNASYPSIEVNLAMTLVLPLNVGGRVPVLMMLGRTGFPAPTQRNADGDPPSTEELIAAGWGFALFDPVSAQADTGAALTRGIIGLVNKGRPRKPDDWGALRAWAWGASRGLDDLESDPAVDGRRVGIEGVSRYGKAALVAMAFDQRFAMVLVGSSGKGGATLLRRNWGEAVENLAGGEYYWMAGNFMRYAASKATFGSGNPGQIPVDAHELIALCAPRLVFLSYGIPERGDSRWLDHEGSFMAAVAAQPVFRLLGARDLGVRGDYREARMPPVNVGLLDGQLAWRQDDGGHTDAPNMKYFIQWADRFRTE